MRFRYLAALAIAVTVSGQATATDCPQTCLAAYNSCRGATDSNKSACAAQYAGCLGYNPFGSDGSLITPTACSGSSTSSASATATGNACATACSSAYNTCRGAPDSNKSACAAQYAGCLGYNPFGSDGSLITPTACSASTSAYTPASTSAYTPASTSASTLASTSASISAPSNGTTTASPTTSSSPIPLTGAADSTKPFIGLLALGALAML